jgi:hypothetical protein
MTQLFHKLAVYRETNWHINCPNRNEQKQNTMMKIAVMAIALLMGSLAFGQEGKKLSPDEKAFHLSSKMTKELKLDGDQATKISEINLGIANKNESVRNATNMSAEQKVEVLKSNDDARLYMYKNVLTAEQFAKFEELEKAAKPEEKL